MKKLALAVLIALFVLASVSFLVAQSSDKQVEAKPAAKELTWLRYDEALAQAAKENKHVLVYFTTSWCGWCKKMKANTFSDAEVFGLMSDKFVLAKVDGESKSKLTIKDTSGAIKEVTERQLTQSYNVTGFPMIIFLRSDGSSIAPLPGYRDAKDFAPALQYISSNAYQEMSYQEFLSKKKG